MFDNIDNVGQKIKGVASATCFLGVLVSILGGGAISVEVNSIVGLITIVVGVVLSWAGSLMVYGFGELVENSKIIADGFSSTKPLT